VYTKKTYQQPGKE